MHQPSAQPAQSSNGKAQAQAQHGSAHATFMPFAEPVPPVPGPAKSLSRSRDRVPAPCAGPQRPWSLHTLHQTPTVQSHHFGGRHAPLREASEAIYVARLQTKPDRPAAQPRGRLRHSPVQRRQYYTSKTPQGAASALEGATSAGRKERPAPWRAPPRHGVGAVRA